MPTCKAIWTDGMRFLHTSGSGHVLVTDTPVAVGGGGTAPSPMELMLHALCGCMGVDIAQMLGKMRQPFTALEISASAERRQEHPRIYSQIDLHVVASGLVDPDKLKRAIDLSLETYCSAAAILRATAPIVPTWEVRPGAAPV
jgi:putative redox protein